MRDPSVTLAPAVARPRRDRVLRARERRENFPVAARVLPRGHRRHLQAIYDVARVIDDLADDPGAGPERRTAALDAFDRDLDRLWTGSRPHAEVLRRLGPTVHEVGLGPRPFHDLVAAGLADQRVRTYATYGDLLAYCRCSADPVGRLVLAVFGVHDERLAALSDRVCTALQLIEHWQDVAEDRDLGRIYLPAEDMAAFGVTEADLHAAHAGPALRALLAFQTRRAVALLDSATGLPGRLPGWARAAVAGYIGGGRAAAQALHRARFDVLAGAPGPRRRDVARQSIRSLLARGEGPG